ncbi:hypothetical protein GGR57DRAFT_253154 [Xylariaceae sp. FL1272]|nr:hypothetical protein GGR57DRAFT_253154 [Xylariaceae sp. FL1272]
MIWTYLVIFVALHVCHLARACDLDDRDSSGHTAISEESGDGLLSSSPPSLCIVSSDSAHEARSEGNTDHDILGKSNLEHSRNQWLQRHAVVEILMPRFATHQSSPSSQHESRSRSTSSDGDNDAAERRRHFELHRPMINSTDQKFGNFSNSTISAFGTGGVTHSTRTPTTIGTGTPDLSSSIAISAPFVNLSSIISPKNTTLGRNATKPPQSPSITPPATTNLHNWNNTTPKAPLNTTRAAFTNFPSVPQSLNHTRFANTTTSIRYSNTSTITTPTPTPTPEKTCDDSGPLFAVQIGQPGGMFDGWYLKLSGDAGIFVPSLNLSTSFNVGDSGHLCTYLSSGPAVAIAENYTTTTTSTTNGTMTIDTVASTASGDNGGDGSAVWFVDAELLLNYTNLGYASLDCEVGDEGAVTCEQGMKRFWTGCGLGLDITADGEGNAVVDGWNCTGVTLSALYGDEG